MGSGPFVVYSLFSSSVGSSASSASSAYAVASPSSNLTPPVSSSNPSIFILLTPRATSSAASFSSGSQPSILSGMALSDRPSVLHSHNSSPIQVIPRTALPFSPRTFCSLPTSISQTPTNTGTLGFSSLATATIAFLVADAGNGGPRVSPGIIRSAPPRSFPTTFAGVCSNGTRRGFRQRVWTAPRQSANL